MSLGDPQKAMHLILWLLLKDTSQSSKVRALRWVRYGGGPKGTPRRAMYLILWLLLKGTSQDPPGWLWGTPRGAMHLFLWMLLKGTSQGPKVHALRCVRYGA